MSETHPPVFTNFTSLGLVQLPERIFRINDEQILKITVQVCPTLPRAFGNGKDSTKIVQRYFVVLHPKSQKPVVVIPQKVQQSQDATRTFVPASQKDPPNSTKLQESLPKGNFVRKSGIFVEEVTQQKQAAIVIRRAQFPVSHNREPETIDLDLDSEELEQSDVIDDDLDNAGFDDDDLDDDEPCMAPIVERLVHKPQHPVTVTLTSEKNPSATSTEKLITRAATNPCKQDSSSTPSKSSSASTNSLAVKIPLKKRLTDQPAANVQSHTLDPSQPSAVLSNTRMSPTSSATSLIPPNPSLYRVPNDLAKTIELRSEVLIKQEPPDTDPLALESTTQPPVQRLISKETLINLPPEKLYPLPSCPLKMPPAKLVFNWEKLSSSHQNLLQGCQFLRQPVPQPQRPTLTQPALNLQAPVPVMPVLPQLPLHPVEVSAWDSLNVEKPPDDLVSKLISDASISGSSKPVHRHYSLEMRTALLTTYIQNHRNFEKTIEIIREKVNMCWPCNLGIFASCDRRSYCLRNDT